MRDGGGIMPDVEAKPDTLPNIAIYLDRIDSTEVMFDYVTDYIASHPTIAPATEFRLTDAEWEDFKQKVVKSGFTYDPVSGKRFDDLVKIARFEGYYDDAREEFEALKAKLNHDVARDLEKSKDVIRQMIESDIISAYYYQSGTVEAALTHDKTVAAAVELLSDGKRYSSTLSPRVVKK